jgi:hypothetical protein
MVQPLGLFIASFASLSVGGALRRYGTGNVVVPAQDSIAQYPWRLAERVEAYAASNQVGAVNATISIFAMALYGIAGSIEIVESIIPGFAQPRRVGPNQAEPRQQYEELIAQAEREVQQAEQQLAQEELELEQMREASRVLERLIQALEAMRALLLQNTPIPVIVTTSEAPEASSVPSGEGTTTSR